MSNDKELKPCPNPQCQSAKVAFNSMLGNPMVPTSVYCRDCLLTGPREPTEDAGVRWNTLTRAADVAGVRGVWDEAIRIVKDTADDYLESAAMLAKAKGEEDDGTGIFTENAGVAMEIVTKLEAARDASRDVGVANHPELLNRALSELRRLCNEQCSYCNSDRTFKVGGRFGVNGCHIFERKGDKYDGQLLGCKANITRRLLLELERGTAVCALCVEKDASIERLKARVPSAFDDGVAYGKSIALATTPAADAGEAQPEQCEITGCGAIKLCFHYCGPHHTAICKSDSKDSTAGELLTGYARIRAANGDTHDIVFSCASCQRNLIWSFENWKCPCGDSKFRIINAVPVPTPDAQASAECAAPYSVTRDEEAKELVAIKNRRATDYKGLDYRFDPNSAAKMKTDIDFLLNLIALKDSRYTTHVNEAQNEAGETAAEPEDIIITLRAELESLRAENSELHKTLDVIHELGKDAGEAQGVRGGEADS